MRGKHHRIRWVICPITGKRGYFTRWMARRRMKEDERDYGLEPGSLNTYRCKHCGRHHIGHTPAWKKKAVA